MEYNEFESSVVAAPGSDKHHVEVSGPDHTVGQLLQSLHDITEIPTTAQKIIFKGTHQTHCRITKEELCMQDIIH